MAFSHARFIAGQIKKYSEQGIESVEDIYKQIKSEISDIDVKLAEVEPLRIERSNLQKAMEHFASILQTDKISSSFDDESTEAVEIRNTIIKIVAAQPNGITNREIIQKFGYNMDAKVIRAVKQLHEAAYIQKDKSQERKIIPGPEFKNYASNNS